MSKTIISFLVFFHLMLQLNAQQRVWLDDRIKVSDLTLFQSMDDEHVYYYLPDKPRLAQDESGHDQFSFIVYAKHEKSRASAEDVKESEIGGGIVHLLATLEVEESQVRQAESALKSHDKDGVIKGPLMYDGGTFSIISSFSKEGKNVKSVVGFGSAPIMEGHKAAVSIMLDKEGAQILWATFQTPTPDISFSFDMQLSGYYKPIKGWVKGNYDKIRKSHDLNLDFRYAYFGAEVGMALEKMIENGIIEVYTEGNDEDMARLIELAQTKLMDAMFEPLPSMGSSSGGQSMPDVNSVLNQYSQSRSSQRSSTSGSQPASSGSRASSQQGGRSSSQGQGRQQETEQPQADAETEQSQADSGQPETEAEAETEQAEAEQPAASEDGGSEQPSSGGSQASRSNPNPSGGSSPGGGEKPDPPINLKISYKFKKQTKKGNFHFKFNKANSATINLRMDENVGKVSKSSLREVVIGPGAFSQREVLVMLDGFNSDDFKSYINFATVEMRKKHDNGKSSMDDIRIDHKNFVDQQNRFKLMYGWNDDDVSNPKWLEYEYRVVWNFFGGEKVETDWKKASISAIAIVPPFQLRNITIEADPDLLGDEVRAIHVDVFYKYGNSEKVEKLILKPKQTELSKSVRVVLPKDSYDFGYQYTWFLKDGTRLASDKLNDNFNFVYVDQKPNQ